MANIILGDVVGIDIHIFRMEKNLYKTRKRRKKAGLHISEADIKCFTKRLLCGEHHERKNT